MSEHVRERLSAYLDRELGAADDDAVLAHLRGCEACRSHLAALTSVDKVARALPVEAPAGYFDTLPGRVRACLETTSAGRKHLSGPTVRRPIGRLPAWTWALAAALLLAVVTPLTLQRAHLPAPPAPEAIPAAPAAPPMTRPGADVGFAPAPAGEAARSDAEGMKAPAEKLKAAAPEKLGREAGASLAAKAEPKPAARALVVATPPPPAMAYPAEARSAEMQSGAAAESPASRAPTAPARRQRVPGPGGPYAQAPSQSQAQVQAPADQAADRVVVGSLAEELAVEDATEGARDKRDKEEAAPALAKSARERDEQGLRGTGALANRVPPADEQEFSRLSAPAPQTVGALRARREAWRTFVRFYPKSPRADEARVRTIEVGMAAWRLEHDPVDLGQARVDAASYLSRPDVAQAARVRAILENVGGP